MSTIRRSLGLAVAVFLAALTSPLGAQPTAGRSAPIIFDPVVITATRVAEPMAEVPAAISVVEKPDIQDARPTVGLDEPLNRVPGVLVQNSGNFAQDLRIQIRGFGTRAAFGVREIKVLVDGLPETLPDGQTQLDSIDLGAIDRIEVLRGPASSLYGNASGGVIQLFTEDGGEAPWAEARLSGGDFGFLKQQIKGGGRAGKARVFLQSSFLRLDGFREQSETRSAIVTGKLRYDFSHATEITVVLNGVHAPEAGDAGGLTRQEVRADRRQARPLNVQLDAGEEILQGRLGVIGNHLAAWGEMSAYAYGLYRDFDNRLPIRPEAGDGIVAFRRFSPGAGARYTCASPVLGYSQQLTVGVDVQHQDDARRRFANLDGRRGAPGISQRERVSSAGPYVRQAFSLRDDLEVSAGIRYDSVRFRVDVDYPAGSSEAGARTMEAWSPAGGVRYSPAAWVSLYANIGTAFQVPTTTELANPDGAGFNPVLDPQEATSYETGARLEPNERLRAGLVLFLIEVGDELIPFESESGRTAYRNAGRSRRYGAEIDWQATWGRAVRWTSALTAMRAEFRDYTVAGNVLDGNAEPGIPSWQAYQELEYRHPGGFSAAIEAFLVDGYPVDDANSARSLAYHWINLRAGYMRAFGVWTLEPFVGLNNITDSAYDGIVRPNALGGRFFEPAPGFNAYAGLTVSVKM